MQPCCLGNDRVKKQSSAVMIYQSFVTSFGWHAKILLSLFGSVFFLHIFILIDKAYGSNVFFSRNFAYEQLLSWLLVTHPMLLLIFVR